MMLIAVQIFELLDTPTSFVSVCRRLHHFGKGDYARARWLLSRFSPHLVIFEAIARSKIFTVNLFKTLLIGGAVLSRNLAQLFRALHKPVKVTGQKHTLWGSSVNAEVAIAVLTKAKELVSDECGVTNARAASNSLSLLHSMTPSVFAEKIFKASLSEVGVWSSAHKERYKLTHPLHDRLRPVLRQQRQLGLANLQLWSLHALAADLQIGRAHV